MLKKTILLLIRIYQKTISPDSGIFSFLFRNGGLAWFGNIQQKPLVLSAICRFYPTCSNYSYKAIEKFGVKKGLILTFKRLSRCHPFNKGGYDPVE